MGTGLALERETVLESIAPGQASHPSVCSRFSLEWWPLGQVMLSGHGGPTLCPNFVELFQPERYVVGVFWLRPTESLQGTASATIAGGYR